MVVPQQNLEKPQKRLRLGRWVLALGLVFAGFWSRGAQQQADASGAVVLPEPQAPPLMPQAPPDNLVLPAHTSERQQSLPFSTGGPLMPGLRDGQVMSGLTSHRLILFTFDDGPDTRNTPRLLNALDERGVKALFFLVVSRFRGESPWHRRHTEIAREIVRRGHFVASHTVDHIRLPLLAGTNLDDQVIEAERGFAEIFGARPWIIRPPGGDRSPRIDAYLAERGYTQMLWNLGTGDDQVSTPEEVTDIFVRMLRRKARDYGERGGIVLLHDLHSWSVTAFSQIMDWIDAENCRLLDLNEELYDVVDDPSIFFVPRADSDPSEQTGMMAPPPWWIAERQARLRDRYREQCEE